MAKKALKANSGITPWIHQRQIVSAPFAYKDISYFFLCGGYGCGKSFSIVFMVVVLCKMYQGEDITIALCSTTITLLNKTVILDLIKLCKKTGSHIEYNQKDNIITIGTIRFLLIASGQPADIYGPNVHITLCDEVDELPEQKAIEAHKALSERTRLTLPDGRKPFIMYFSTVHGYRGLYKIVRKLKSDHLKYILVRGLTKNNKSLDPQYVKNLYAIYDEQERLAYLEGMFINLQSGRVYSDYNDETCKCAPFEITKNMTVYVGQDLNSGFSKATAVVKKDKCLYIVHGWSFKEIGGAPAIMRSTFAQNEILWFPDCSGKEILKGYKQEIIDNGIQCRIGSSNPRILDTVFYVNKLFKLGKLKVFDCKATDEVSEALKVQAYNDMGQPEKGKGETDPDHFCFIAGTMIATSEGQKPIEKIKKGDLVLTEKGYRKVKAAGKTGRAKVITRIGLTGTPNHPVKTRNGFAPLESVTDYISIRETDIEWQKLLFLMESHIDVIQTQKMNQTANIMLREKVQEWQGLLADFIETYGNIITEKYLRDMIYTIKTEIQKITTSQILNVSNEVHIIKNFIKSSRRTHLRKMIIKKRLNGTEAQKVMHGTQGTEGFMNENALRVERFTQHTQRKAKEVQTAKENYSVAEAALKSTTTENVQDVYNLSVSGTHTYFANGVLVHNCDSVRYVIYRICRADPDFMDLKELSRENVKENGYLNISGKAV